LNFVTAIGLRNDARSLVECQKYDDICISLDTNSAMDGHTAGIGNIIAHSMLTRDNDKYHVAIL